MAPPALVLDQYHHHGTNMMMATRTRPPQQRTYCNNTNGPSMMSNMALKCLLVYKVVMLENARSVLEEELRDFTTQASEYVQGFLESSCTPSSDLIIRDDLVVSLDTKRRALDRLLGFFKDITTQPAQSHSTVQQRSEDGVAAPGGTGSMTSDVPKKTENPLLGTTGGPITKTEKVMSSQQVKQSQIPLNPPKAAQSDDDDDDDDDNVICSVSSGHDDTVVETSVTSPWEGKYASSSCHLIIKESEEKYVFVKDSSSSSSVVEPPTNKVHCRKVSTVPTVQPLGPKISDPVNPSRELLLDTRAAGAVHAVQHQKQTTSQLLHFLKTSALRNKGGAMEVTTFIEWRRMSRPASPNVTMRASRNHRRDGTAAEPPPAQKRKMIGDAVEENQAPVFQLKRVDSSGAMTYTYVNATKTELWDVGDVFTDSSSEASSSACESEDTTDDNQSEASAAGLSLTPTAEELPRSEKKKGSVVVASVVVDDRVVSIPAFSIKKLDEMEVVVSHIASPGKFHVQHADATERLKAHLSDDWKATSLFVEQNSNIPDIGTLVLAWLPTQEQWVRARVTKICGMRGGGGGRSTTSGGVMDATPPDIEVEVRRLDYGDTCCVSLRNIRALTSDLLLLPLQAVQVSLANVTPVDGRYWSEEAVDWFRAIVENRTLWARLYPQGSRVMAELFLDRGKVGTTRRGASLSVRLTQNGHAKHDKMKQFNGVKKRGTFRMKDSPWEEYLISFCAQKKK